MNTPNNIYVTAGGEWPSLGIYTKRGTANGKDYYNLMGFPDSEHTAAAIYFEDCWRFYKSVGSSEAWYSDPTDVAHPGLVEVWNVNNAATGPAPTVTALDLPRLD